MNQTFLTQLNIMRVRHLKNIEILLSGEQRKNLIITGTNGSGKTSVLNSLIEFLSYVISQKLELQNLEYGCTASFTSFDQMLEHYEEGKFIIAYYSDVRKVDITEYSDIEKVELQAVYKINDKPAKDLGKYLVNLKTTQAFARVKNDENRANEIQEWFNRFENILRKIYNNDSLVLDFDIDTFQFHFQMSGKEPFTFNTMSMGYAAIFDIVSDLIMRMESQHRYDLEGIVLIDEIETHLHVELQRKIIPILTDLFPNIQFIMTTHSPFVLSSAKNAAIFDLDTQVIIQDRLPNLSYEDIVAGSLVSNQR